MKWNNKTEWEEWSEAVKQIHIKNMRKKKK